MTYKIDYINRMDIKRKQLQNSNIPNVPTLIYIMLINVILLMKRILLLKVESKYAR